jgi:hypothetical protein
MRKVAEKGNRRLLRANDDSFIGEGVMLKWNGMALDGADEGYNSSSVGRGILQLTGPMSAPTSCGHCATNG